MVAQEADLLRLGEQGTLSRRMTADKVRFALTRKSTLERGVKQKGRVREPMCGSVWNRERTRGLQQRAGSIRLTADGMATLDLVCPSSGSREALLGRPGLRTCTASKTSDSEQGLPYILSCAQGPTGWPASESRRKEGRGRGKLVPLLWTSHMTCAAHL
jgi:hypothetical protein